MKAKQLLTLMLALTLLIFQFGSALGRDPSLSRVVADGEDDWYEQMVEWNDDDDSEDLEKKKGMPLREAATIPLFLNKTKKAQIEAAWKSLRMIYQSDEKIRDLVGTGRYTENKRDWARTAIDTDNDLLYETLSENEKRYYKDMNIICELFMYYPALVNTANIDFFLTEINEVQSITLPQGVPAIPREDAIEVEALGEYLFPVLLPEGVTSDRADKIYYMFTNENPQYYFLDVQSGTYQDEDDSAEVGKGARLYTAFIRGGVDDPAEIPGMTLSDFNGVRENVQKAIEEIKNDSRYTEGNEWTMVRTAHDWLVNHVDYDYFSGGTIPVSKIEGTDYEATVNQFLLKSEPTTKNGDGVEIYQSDGDKTLDQTLFGTFGRSVGAEYPILYSDTNAPRYMENRFGVDTFTGEEIKIDHYTVCAGYAASLAFLCQKLGLKAVARSGSAHAWNIISIDSEEYNFDATWNDAGGKQKPYPVSVTYTYFARDDKFFEPGHPKATGYGQALLPCSTDIKPHGHAYYNIDEAGDFRICMGDTENVLLYELVLNSEGNHELRMDDGKYVVYDLPDTIKEQVETLDDTPGFEDHKDPDFPTVKEISKAIIAQKQQGTGAGVGSVTPTSTTTPTASGSSQTSSAATASSSSGSSSGGSSGGGGGSSSSKLSFSQGGSVSSGKGVKRGVYSKCGKGKVSYEPSPKKLNAKKLKVPSKIRIGKKKYKVTRIVANAFTGFDKLEELVIGKEIRVIGSYAFFGCKKLKSLTIRSKHLSAKGIKNAFKDSYVKTVYVPADKVSAYKKIFTQKITGSDYKIKVKAIK